MTAIIYVARVTREHAEAYTAQFADLPDLSVDGSDLAELLARARQALVARLEALEAAGEIWPAATRIEDIPAQPGLMLLPIDVVVDDTPVRVNISLGERLVQRLDAAAGSAGMTRSGFIAKAVRTALDETGRRPDNLDALGRRLQDELNLLGRRINDSIGPESPFTRRMNELDGWVYEGVRKAADSVSAVMARKRDDARSATGAEQASGPLA